MSFGALALAKLFGGRPRAHTRRVMPSLVVLATAACAMTLGGCGETTRVRLVLQVVEDRFRPNHIDLIWGIPGGPQRGARVPASGPLAATGSNLGSVLITLDDASPGERRFIARGLRGDERVSGNSSSLPWKKGGDSTLTMTLGCYEDPEWPALPGCPAEGGGEPVDAGAQGGADARD